MYLMTWYDDFFFYGRRRCQLIISNRFFFLFHRQMIRVPKKTPEGYELLMYRLIDTDPSKIMFADCLKGFCMFNDIRLTEDLLADGYVVVMDMKGVRLSHITRVQFGPMRSIMAYIQEAHPARLKKIYICHAASFVNQIMAMVKPLIKSEMLQLLHFTTKGPESLFEKDILPKVRCHWSPWHGINRGQNAIVIQILILFSYFPIGI